MLLRRVCCNKTDRSKLMQLNAVFSFFKFFFIFLFFFSKTTVVIAWRSECVVYANLRGHLDELAP